MKLWTTVGIGRLPEILKNGFDNPYSDEILFYDVPEIAAEQALEFEGELAFIETEIPDAEIENWFTYCMGITGDTYSDVESQIAYLQEEGGFEEEIKELSEQAREIEAVNDARSSLKALGFACLSEVLRPDMLKLLDPTTMIDAVHTGNVEAIAQAVREAEPQAFKTLSAAFWVWLMMLLGQIFGPGYGAFEGGEEERIRTKKKRKRKKAASKN